MRFKQIFQEEKEKKQDLTEGTKPKKGDDVYGSDDKLIGQITKIKNDMATLTKGDEVDLEELMWDKGLNGFKIK